MNYLEINYKEWYKKIDINLTSATFVKKKLKNIYKKKKET